MANQNTVTYNLQDNVTPGLKLMQDQAVKTAAALQKIGGALSNLPVAEAAMNNFAKAQQNLANIIKSNTQLIGHENKELANISDAETAIKGLAKVEESLGLTLKTNGQLLSHQTDELNKFDKSMQNVGNSAGKTGTEHFGKVTKGQDEMHKGFGKIADVIDNKFRTALDQANNITTKANNLYGSTSTLVGDLSGGITSFSSVITIAKDATAVWSDVQGTFNAVMDANPIGATIAVIQGLIKALTWAWNNFEGFREVVMGVWEVIKPFGKVVMDVLVVPFKLAGDGLQAVYYGVKAVWDALTGHFKDAKADAAQATYYAFEAPIKDIKDAANSAIKDTKDAVDAAKDNYKKGAKEGDASWKADHPEAGLKGTKTKLAISGPSADNAPAVNFNTNSGVKTTPAYSTEPKKITYTNNIQNLVKEFTINTNNLKDGVANAKKMVADALVEAVKDFNIKSGAAI